MEIKQLRVFLKVADAKSFLKAAEELYITRQAITKTIDQLEDELQLELFVRNQKGAMMTPAGIYLYPRAATLVAEFDKLKSDTMNAHRSYRPQIRVSLSQGIYGHFAKKLREYGKKYSAEMDLQISSCFDTDAEMLLADKKAEITVSFTKPSKNIANSTKILESETIFLVSRDNPFLLNRMPSMKALLSQPRLLYAPDSKHPLWWYDHTRSRDICCSDLDYLFTLLRRNEGVLPMPRISVPEYLDFAVQLPSPDAVEQIPIYFSTLYPDHYASLTFSLIDTLQADIFGAAL